ncbi:hypothetical protein V6N11_073134 [Hibiscus sabdariffa]|uniref:Uncharacterized protein n=1 Tax=Hibiscus sabdariffa TaxID=183260 RepID=A0ABR2P968_9ROSI
MSVSCGWRCLHRPLYAAWLLGESPVDCGVAWCCTGGLIGSLSRLKQSLTGLLVGSLEGSEGSGCVAAIAIPGRGLCTTRCVAYVGLQVHCDLYGPVLVLLFHGGVALWCKLAPSPSVLRCVAGWRTAGGPWRGLVRFVLHRWTARISLPASSVPNWAAVCYPGWHCSPWLRFVHGSECGVRRVSLSTPCPPSGLAAALQTLAHTCALLASRCRLVAQVR